MLVQVYMARMSNADASGQHCKDGTVRLQVMCLWRRITLTCPNYKQRASGLRDLSCVCRLLGKHVVESVSGGGAVQKSGEIFHSINPCPSHAQVDFAVFDDRDKRVQSQTSRHHPITAIRRD